ncbi:MAG: DUF835 domain-containing protein [Thermoplasmata archaeon]|nr:DUF835 domain-containing protein [Thermoplasmata archaeon]
MQSPGSKIPAGRSYLFVEDSEYAAFAVLRYLLVEGRRALILSKTHPEKIAERYQVDCPVIWIVGKPPPGSKVITIDPQRLGRIYSLIADFVKNNPGAVVLLTGIDYLIAENDFQAVMKTLQLANETVAMSNSILLIPVSPESMQKQEFSFLEREIPPIDINVDFL